MKHLCFMPIVRSIVVVLMSSSRRTTRKVWRLEAGVGLEMGPGCFHWRLGLGADLEFDKSASSSVS